MSKTVQFTDATYNATPVTFTFTIPPPSVTHIRPSWWKRLRKHPFVDSTIKQMVSETVKELVGWARDFVPQLFQREHQGDHRSKLRDSPSTI